MTVFFDHQIFSLQTYGGISRYVGELIRGINQSGRGRAHLSLLLSENEHLAEFGLRRFSWTKGRSFARKQPLLYQANQWFTQLDMSRTPFDVFHATYYDPYFLGRLRGKPAVVTFHDMTHERFAGQFPELAHDQDVIRRKQVIARQADRLIAISANTKRDMAELLAVDPDKIDVIHLGCPLPPGSGLRNGPVPAAPGEPYLLFIGNRGLYKNFDRFMQAVAPLLRAYGMRVVCGGGGSFTAAEQQLLAQLQVTDRVEQVAVSDATLPQLYRQAYAFVFPSLYEGFGLPVLEAFACDCPCLLSTGGSLPEVGGEAALYFNPTQPDAIAAAVQQLLDNKALREPLVEQARARLPLFTWQRTVDKTISLYQALT